VEITLDSGKEVSNIEKHGVSLADASGFEWDEAVYGLTSGMVMASSA